MISNNANNGSSNPLWLNEINNLDGLDPKGKYNVDGSLPDPNYVGGIKPRLRSRYRVGKRKVKNAVPRM